MKLLILLYAVIAMTYAAPRKQIRKGEARLQFSESRSGMEDLRLSVKGLGKVSNLSLKKVDDILAKRAALITISSSDSGETIIEESTMKNDLNVYKDTEKRAIIGVRDGEVHGVLDEKTTIKFENGKHFVYEKVFELEPTDGEIIKDYIEIPDSNQEFQTNSENIDNNISDSESRQDATYIIELLLITDSEFSNQFSSDQAYRDYLILFVNQIQDRYSALTNPSYFLKLVAAMKIVSPDDEDFITSTCLNTGCTIFDGVTMIENLRDFTNSTPHLQNVNYDIAYLITARDIALTNGTHYNTGLAGIAYVEAACNSIGYNVGLGEDRNAAYDGGHTAAHEIAHNMGSPHDPESGDEFCLWSLGYLMAYPFPSVNKWNFSPCSIKSMKDFAATASCLTTTNFVKDEPCRFNVGYNKTMPGEVMSMTQQCQKIFKDTNAVVDISNYANKNNVCQQLKCQSNGWIYSESSYPAEHSKCDDGKWCDDGQCVPKP